MTQDTRDIQAAGYVAEQNTITHCGNNESTGEAHGRMGVGGELIEHAIYKSFDGFGIPYQQRRTMAKDAAKAAIAIMGTSGDSGDTHMARFDSASPAIADELAEALENVKSWISNWSPNFADDDEWQVDEDRMNAALTKYRESRK